MDMHWIVEMLNAEGGVLEKKVCMTLGEIQDFCAESAATFRGKIATVRTSTVVEIAA